MKHSLTAGMILVLQTGLGCTGPTPSRPTADSGNDGAPQVAPTVAVTDSGGTASGGPPNISGVADATLEAHAKRAEPAESAYRKPAPPAARATERTVTGFAEVEHTWGTFAPCGSASELKIPFQFWGTVSELAFVRLDSPLGTYIACVRATIRETGGRKIITAIGPAPKSESCCNPPSETAQH